MIHRKKKSGLRNYMTQEEKDYWDQVWKEKLKEVNKERKSVEESAPKKKRQEEWWN